MKEKTKSHSSQTNSDASCSINRVTKCFHKVKICPVLAVMLTQGVIIINTPLHLSGSCSASTRTPGCVISTLPSSLMGAQFSVFWACHQSYKIYIIFFFLLVMHQKFLAKNKSENKVYIIISFNQMYLIINTQIKFELYTSI